MIQLSDHEKTILQRIGKGSYGRELAEILAKARNQASSLEGLTPGGDHTAAVEGRLLFKEFADEIIRHLTRPDHVRKLRDPDSMLGTDDYS